MRILRLLLVPLSILVAVLAHVVPARTGVVASGETVAANGGKPAVVILAPKHADQIRQRLGSGQRVYTVSRWNRSQPRRLAQLLAAVEEDEVILVGDTHEHLRTTAMPESAPRVVGRVVLQRPVDEVAWSVSRLAEHSSARSSDSLAKRQLYRVLRPGV